MSSHDKLLFNSKQTNTTSCSFPQKSEIELTAAAHPAILVVYN
jgi:hypothetical protein